MNIQSTSVIPGFIRFIQYISGHDKAKSTFGTCPWLSTHKLTLSGDIRDFNYDSFREKLSGLPRNSTSLSVFAIEPHKSISGCWYVLCILAGFGGGIMYVTASSVSMTNFEDELLGLISGVIHAFRSGIPGLLMVLDMYTFSPDYNSPEYRRRRLIIMFATLAILYTIANILGIVFYGDYRKRKRYHSVLGPHASQSVTVEKSSKFSRSSRRRLETTMSITESTPLVGARRAVYKDWWKYLKEIDYHLIFWPSIILLGFRTAFGSNISTFAASYGLQTYAQIAMSILPIVSTFSKPPIGWCSDALLNVVPRSIFLFTWSILVCIIVSLCLVFFAEAVMQGIALMMIVIASSYIQTLAPPLLVAMFGRTFFPIGWSLITVGWAGLTSLFNVIIGHFYDANIVGDGRNCLGNACYRDSFIIALSMSVLAALGLAGLVYRERAFRRDHEDTTAALEESVNTWTLRGEIDIQPRSSFSYNLTLNWPSGETSMGHLLWVCTLTKVLSSS